MALRDGMCERRRRECDREGLSSVFRRKMRSRSGMHDPVIHKCGRRIPYAGRSRFAGPSPCASGRDRVGLSSVFRRKMRPRSWMHAPSQSIIAVAASPTAARSRFAGPSGNAPGAPFARSLTKQTARKAVVPMGCVKIERDRAGWNSDRPDFTSNALREDLFRGS
jgi:hypothetical protein